MLAGKFVGKVTAMTSEQGAFYSSITPSEEDVNWVIVWSKSCSVSSALDDGVDGRFGLLAGWGELGRSIMGADEVKRERDSCLLWSLVVSCSRQINKFKSLHPWAPTCTSSGDTTARSPVRLTLGSIDSDCSTCSRVARLAANNARRTRLGPVDEPRGGDIRSMDDVARSNADAARSTDDVPRWWRCAVEYNSAF